MSRTVTDERIAEGHVEPAEEGGGMKEKEKELARPSVKFALNCCGSGNVKE